MNPQNNWLSWIGNGLTTVAAYLGITTLDLTYLVWPFSVFFSPFLAGLIADRKSKLTAMLRQSVLR